MYVRDDLHNAGGTWKQNLWKGLVKNPIWKLFFSDRRTGIWPGKRKIYQGTKAGPDACSCLQPFFTKWLL